MRSRLLICTLLLGVCTGAFGQYKHDLALKIGSLEKERAQLDYRFHLKSPYTIIATYCYGTVAYTNEGLVTSFSDSTFTSISEREQTWFHTIKAGVQRKFMGFASDVFYAGATIGAGYFTQRNSFYESTFAINDSLPQTQVSNFWQNEEISSTELHQNARIVQTQLALSFGMDVPISKRFTINAEVGLLGNFVDYINSSRNYAEVLVGFSGGVRYQFAKRE